MMKNLLLALLLGSVAISGKAQDDNSSKLSVTTQMFLNEQKGELSFERNTTAKKKPGLHPVEHVRANKVREEDSRLYAAPDTIDGKVYIAAYLRLADASAVGEVEALGVVLQEEFNNGLWTSLIPVDKISEVAAVSKVSRINVSPLMKAFTKTAREKTNTDDVLTLSTDAISAGLKQKYDGTGVVLGIIDTGIDFNHIAFKDVNGNSRIKQAYVYNGSTAKTYTGSSITSNLTDDNTGDHGTHTSTTAGGSSVKVSGTTVTVTDDHANATYGGMAPGADLYLAGVKNLNSTYLSNAVKAMCTYADQQGKPLVVSNSWGSQMGPHDGTGDEADVYNSLFGDSHPNRVALFAASNDAGNGGYHLKGTASSSNPLRSILRCHYYSDTDDGFMYHGFIANAWARSTSVSSMTCKIYVLNSSTGALIKTISVTPSTSGTKVSELSTYYSGTLYVFKDYVTSDKTQVMLYANELMSKSYDSNYNSNYTLAVEFAPSSGSCVIDVWGGNAGAYFTNHLTTSGYAWTAGTDDGCNSDESTISNVISIGAYVSANTWKDYNGTSHSMEDVYTMGDIASFSSWGTAGNSPSGTMVPWISAPGARLAAGVNHNHTTSVDDYSYYGSNYNSDLVVNNSSYPYAMMEGTSMATPTAAGIVALWMQASLDANAKYKNLTVNDVKTIMKETAITDSYTTTGANKDHFGNGKIDALAGIKYILGATSDPSISVDPEEVTFENCYATRTYTKTITVTGANLQADIAVAKSGSGVFTIDKTRIAQTNGQASAELTITYAPTSAGTHNATLTLSSTGAETVNISLTGTAEAATPTIIADKEALEFTAMTGNDATQTINVSSRFLTDNITATLTDAAGVFSVDNASIAATEDGVELVVTFNAQEEGTYTGNLLLASAGAASVSIALTATANDGGTASDNFLDIAKYKTIDEAGWNTSYVDNLYKYTEYEDNEVAWLTLPVYGAWAGVYYNSHPQQWIQSSLTNNNSYAGKTWTYNPMVTNPYNGSSSYFTSAAARVMGYNGRTNTTKKEVDFYVTNVTAVKALGIGANGASATYPAAIRVYECTVGADGKPTASATAAKSATSNSTSTTSTFTLSITDLDATKVYKVEASVYRGYLYEIAFQTPIEVEKIPEVTATPTELAFETYAGVPVEKTFTVTGKNLTNKVTASVSGDGFGIDVTEVSVSDATTGKVVTVTFTPQEAGSYSGTVTLTTEGAEQNAVVSLTGEAEAATPTIVVDPASLTFVANVGTSVSKTIQVSGRFLAEDVAVVLTDAKKVFAVDQESLTIDEDGATLTVTFEAPEEGDFTGHIALSSTGAETITIALSATANDGGTASDSYFNIAKYQTIDEAGWNTSYVNNLYKYTEYEDNEVAWLTLPLYGAYAASRYSNYKWIKYEGTYRVGATWTVTTTTAETPYLGSDAYYTSATANAYGRTSNTNTTEQYMAFYVTNTTGIKLSGKNTKNVEDSYPTTIQVYECTVNEDGTVTESTSLAHSATNGTASADLDMSVMGLDASKVYMIRCGVYRSYLYEIAFQTPLKKKVVGDVNRDGEVTIADVTALTNIILGKLTREKDSEQYDFDAADVNGDSLITIADVTALVNIILGKD